MYNWLKPIKLSKIKIIITEGLKHVNIDFTTPKNPSDPQLLSLKVVKDYRVGSFHSNQQSKEKLLMEAANILRKSVIIQEVNL